MSIISPSKNNQRINSLLDEQEKDENQKEQTLAAEMGFDDHGQDEWNAD